MPIPQVVRIDPRDLDRNKAIGISIPFNAGGVFNQTFSTKDQVKSNLINFLLTYKGERILNPEFGADLPKLLFEPLTEDTYLKIQNQIISNVSLYIPEINILDIGITPNIDFNSISISIDYQLKLSGQQDNITIELQ